jgi:hypothetical protein
MIRIVAYTSPEDDFVQIAIGTWKSDDDAIRNIQQDGRHVLQVQEFFLEERSAHLSILEQIASTAVEDPEWETKEDRTLGEVLETLVKTAFEFGREFEREFGSAQED